jgi:2-polyprenyl-6-methoxyphenol hydroxylase-like FAD-dependent oxidoreductase
VTGCNRLGRSARRAQPGGTSARSRIIGDPGVSRVGEQHDDKVTARLRALGSGEQSTVSARYLVAADGHKGTVGAAAGIGVHGRQRHASAPAMFASFDADLRPAPGGAAVGLWHLQNAALPRGNATRPPEVKAATRPCWTATTLRGAGPP